MKTELDEVCGFLDSLRVKSNRGYYYEKGGFSMMLIGNALSCSYKGRHVTAFFKDTRKTKKMFLLLKSTSDTQDGDYVVESLAHADTHAWKMNGKPIEVQELS